MNEPDDRRMPVDSDLGAAERPAHRQWRLVGLVAVGGMLGTAAREALSLAFPTRDVPWTIGAINLVGAFLLGALLAALTRRGEDVGRRRDLRLALGTGVLGGFTTYSALAADTATLLTSGSSSSQTIGVLYAAVSIVAGALASVLGMWVGGRTPTPRAASGTASAASPESGGPSSGNAARPTPEDTP